MALLLQESRAQMSEPKKKNEWRPAWEDPNKFPNTISSKKPTSQNPPEPPKKETVLEVAQRLVYGERAELYGPALEQQEQIAKLWSVIFGTEIQAEKVPLALAALKIARILNTLPDTNTTLTKEDMIKHFDSVVDLAGYAGVIGKCAEERGWW